MEREGKGKDYLRREKGRRRRERKGEGKKEKME